MKRPYELEVNLVEKLCIFHIESRIKVIQKKSFRPYNLGLTLSDPFRVFIIPDAYVREIIHL